MMNRAISERTRHLYQTGLNSYLHFLDHFALRVGTQLPYPTEAFLVSYVFYCHSVKNVAYSTIKSYLAGIRFHFVLTTGNNPLYAANGAMERLQMILRAVKKCQIPKPKKRQPMTAPILRGMIDVLTSTPTFGLVNDAMLAACITTAFFGFLRCGEFCMDRSDSEDFLSVNDVLWESNSSGYTVHLRSSKTDPFRRGVDLFISALGPNNPLCPVRHLQRYMLIRRHSTVPISGPLFLFNECALTRARFIFLMKAVLTQAGYDSDHYSGHSYRAGAASSCAMSSVQDHLIKVLGRWKSDAYQRYISTSRESIRRAHLAMSLV